MFAAGGRFDALQQEVRALKEGGGGGTSGGMDGRVDRLEKDVADLRVDMATVKENLRHLPSKPWMFTTLLGLLTAIGALVALIVRFVPPAA